MSKERFNNFYETEYTPWELNRPDSNLVSFIKSIPILPCRVLEIGCGTGSNAIWLSQSGFDVSAADFSSLAIERARKKALAAGADIRFYEKDFLSDRIGDFDFLFDRGCFHSFDSREERKNFVQRAHAHLNEKGYWLSFLGNADAPDREEGPPVRSAMDIVQAVEPYFEILFLESGMFDSELEKSARCWNCLMQKRLI